LLGGTAKSPPPLPLSAVKEDTVGWWWWWWWWWCLACRGAGRDAEDGAPLSSVAGA
jgi:hypothetical protein